MGETQITASRAKVYGGPFLVGLPGLTNLRGNVFIRVSYISLNLSQHRCKDLYGERSQLVQSQSRSSRSELRPS